MRWGKAIHSPTVDQNRASNQPLMIYRVFPLNAKSLCNARNTEMRFYTPFSSEQRACWSRIFIPSNNTNVAWLYLRQQNGDGWKDRQCDATVSQFLCKEWSLVHQMQSMFISPIWIIWFAYVVFKRCRTFDSGTSVGQKIFSGWNLYPLWLECWRFALTAFWSQVDP